MFIPKRLKYKKLQKRKIKGAEFKIKATTLQFGNFGLQALENGRINPKQIEAARRVMYVKRLVWRNYGFEYFQIHQ